MIKFALIFACVCGAFCGGMVYADKHPTYAKEASTIAHKSAQVANKTVDVVKAAGSAGVKAAEAK